ncbi:MAG: ribokinase [Melioribacteraceae bacterium]|nr:ribokinase [Melioribacteraceae bacterium]
MTENSVLVVGSANMDLVVQTDRFPKPGETVFGNNFEMFPGGKGANQAVGCAKLGIRTYFIGKTGNDEFGARVIRSMMDSGVNTSLIKHSDNNTTGTALITVDGKGENEIIVISGTNMLLNSKDVEENSKTFEKVSVVLSQLEVPLESVLKAAELAARNNIPFILNPAPGKQLPDNLLKLTSILTPNETELEIISGRKVSDLNSIESAAKLLLEKGVKNVIVTIGAKGSLLISNNSTKLYEPFETEAVDTTAAGDSFSSALAFSVAEGYELDKAIEFANCSASIAVTRMGAQTSMPKYEEVISKLSQYKSIPED